MTGFNKLMLAADGGGTKTEFLLFDEFGNIHKRLVLAGSNPNSVGMNTAIKVLSEGVGTLISECTEVSGVYLGISGCGDPANKTEIYNYFNNKYKFPDMLVEPDYYNILHSCIPSKTYVSAICGTGSVVCAKTRDSIKRLGGYGYLFEKCICGYALGREAIYASLKAEDGLEEGGELTRLVQAHFGGPLHSNIKRIYEAGNDYIADMARLVFEAYDIGDGVAEKIIDNSTGELSHLINACISLYDVEPYVALSGGLTKRADILVPHLKKYCKGTNFIIADMPQIFGAAVYCCSQFADLSENFKQTLKLQLQSN